MKRLNLSIIVFIFFSSTAICQVRPAIDFKLKNIRGNTISLDDFKSQKGIILTFVSNVCPVAELYQKRVEALQNKYAAKGYPVVAIDPVDDFAAMKDTATARKYSYYFLYDSTQKIALSYKVSANTHTFILLNTPTGFKIVYEGAIDNDYSGDNISKKYVENAVDALLNKKAITTAKTRVLGCPIRYRN
jgi:peroxiredoxin